MSLSETFSSPPKPKDDLAERIKVVRDLSQTLSRFSNEQVITMMQLAWQYRSEESLLTLAEASRQVYPIITALEAERDELREACLYNGNLNRQLEDKLAIAKGALQASLDHYGKPGGPWNVPSDPGGWLERTREALVKLGER